MAERKVKVSGYIREQKVGAKSVRITAVKPYTRKKPKK